MNTSSFWFQGEPPNPLDPGSPIGNSLRFRGAQYLYTQILKETPSNQTWSLWFKLADPNDVGSNYLTGDDSQGWGFGFASGYNGALLSNTSQEVSDQKYRDPSAWYNLVITGNPTSSRQWMNGEEITGLTTLLPSAWQYSWKLLIGNLYPGQAFYFDGYMADVYFLESLVSGPEMFGRFNENGVWVPKDPGFSSAAVYSDYLTVSGGWNSTYPATKAFDGSPSASNYCQSVSSGELVATFSPPDSIPFTKLEVYSPSTAQAGRSASWDGNTVDLIYDDWTTIYDGSGEISSTKPLTFNNPAGATSPAQLAISGIRINGDKVLVDQNIWSNYLYTSDRSAGVNAPIDWNTTEKNFLPQYPATMAFDGSADSSSMAYSAANGDYIVWRPANPITNVTKVEVASGSNSRYELNNGTISLTCQLTTAPTYDVVYDDPNNPITLTNLAVGYMGDNCTGTGNIAFSALAAVKINGVVYTDGVNDTWGPDGFHLTFADPSNVGKDYSGNGNDCTAVGFDTVPSTTWSRWLTCTGLGFHTQDTLSAKAAFDWNNANPTGVYALSLDYGATITFAPEIPVTYSSSLKVYVFGDNSTSVTLDGTTVSNVIAGAYAEFTGSGVISVDKPLTINGGTGQASLAVITIDEVPNGWTNGLYNTGGSDYDVMQDSPTDNYPTYNPLYQSVVSGFNTAQNYTDANLTAGTAVSGYHGTAFTTVPVLPKIYLEVTSGPIIAPYPILCFGLQNQTTIDDSVSVKYYQTGQCQLTNALPAFTAGDVISLSFDQAANTLTSSVNGGPSTTFDLGTTFTLDDDVFFWVDCHTPSTATVNFGQQPFLYPITEGYTALHTSTMPAPTIYDGREEFQAITGFGPGGGILYSEGTGPIAIDDPITILNDPTYNGSSTATPYVGNSPSYIWDAGKSIDSVQLTWYNQSGTQTYATSLDGQTWFGEFTDNGLTITFNPGQPFRYVRKLSSTAGAQTFQTSYSGGSILDKAQQTFPSGLWWIKDRVNDNQHQLVDSMRGTTAKLSPQTSPGWQEYVPPAGDSVAWCWNAPDTWSEGASTGYRDVKAGFSMFNTDGNTPWASGIPQGVAHGLGKTPEFYMFYNDPSPSGIFVWHKDLTPGNYIYLNYANAQTTNGWSNIIGSPPDDTDLWLSPSGYTSDTVYCYAWTSIPGYSAFGKYTGNASTDGPFIYTGFKPAFILVKAITSAYPWQIYDATRSPYNPAIGVLQPDLQTKEISSDNYALDILSNGFKWRAASTYGNDSTDYIYAAFAENPFQSPVTAR